MGKTINIIKKIIQNKKALVGLIMTSFVIIVAIFAPVIAPYDYQAMGVGRRFEPPSRDYLMGTDFFGRDVFTRVIYGARVSLLVALVVASFAAAIGVIVGLLAGYFRGFLDFSVMRIVDIIFTFPWLLMALTVGAIIGPGLKTVIVSLAIVYSPQVARLIRGETLVIREREYIEASRALGASPVRIMLRHILPNSVAALIVQFTLIMAFSILAEAGISYLGFGTQPPMPSWGLMLSDGRDFMFIAPHISIYPGLSIMFSVLAFNFLGDGLRDVFDPRMRGACQGL